MDLGVMSVVLRRSEIDPQVPEHGVRVKNCGCEQKRTGAVGSGGVLIGVTSVVLGLVSMAF